MKKKIISLALVVAMLAIAVVGGTMAYFTDTDKATNVMTIGNVSIVQNEQQREYVDGEYTGKLIDFVQDKDLIPAVFYDEEGNVVPNQPDIWAKDEYTTAGETAYMVSDDVIENQVDKIVSVTNNGTRAAYVRTVFLWQDSIDSEGVHLADKIGMFWTENGGQNSGYYNWVMAEEDTDMLYTTIEVDGVNYIATVHYYEEALEAGATSKASLKSFLMAPRFDHSDDMFGDAEAATDGTYNVIALSQAVQTEGFKDDRVALNAAFGEVNAENLAEWFDGTVVAK